MSDTAIPTINVTLAFGTETGEIWPFLVAGYCEWTFDNHGGHVPDYYTQAVREWDCTADQTTREFTLAVDLNRTAAFEDVADDTYVAMTFIHPAEGMPYLVSAYDNTTNDAHNGVPDFYALEIAEALGGNDLTTTEVFVRLDSREIASAFKPKKLTANPNPKN